MKVRITNFINDILSNLPSQFLGLIIIIQKNDLSVCIAKYQRPNRTGFYRFEFGSVRLRFLESSSGSVRFDCISKRSVRVRFGSTVFSKNQFGFGSVRVHFQNISSDSIRFDSAQILCIYNRISF